MISGTLILPSTGHTGDLGDTQLQSGGPRRSSRLDLPRVLVLKRLSRLNLLRDLPAQGSQEIHMPQPTQGFDLQEVVMTQPAWASAPLPGDTRLSGCNGTG